MAALQGLAWLLGLQAVGELLARGLSLPFPGPVIGLLLLLLALRFTPVQSSVRGTAEFLLSHLSLLFVPVGVGVMTHLTLLADNGLQLAIVIVQPSRKRTPAHVICTFHFFAIVSQPLPLISRAL